MLIADVFINIPVKRIVTAFSYIVPAEYSFLSAGWRVVVPFGNRQAEGFVFSVKEIDAADISGPLKEIISVTDDEAWFSPTMIAEAKWISEFYLCSFAEAMRLFMPGKSGVKITACYEASSEATDNMLLGIKSYAEIYNWLKEKGTATKKDIIDAFPQYSDGIESLLDNMVRHSLLLKSYSTKKRESKLYKQIYVLKADANDSLLKQYNRKKAQKRLIEFLAAHKSADNYLLKSAGFSSTVIKALLSDNIITEKQERIFRDSYNNTNNEQLIEQPLSDEQQTAYKAVSNALQTNSNNIFLLKGVTGSGKTRVYIESVKKARTLGKTAIVLVPEIALTGQVVNAFKSYFCEDIVVLHSRLSIAERNDAIFRIRRREAGIVIGARSALFVPLDNIGLIVIDEEQDMSYKQEESPAYNARQIAEAFAKINCAVLLLGSATPSLESYYNAQNGKYKLLSLTKRIDGKSLPTIKAVDMRQELRMGNRHIISRSLETLIAQTIKDNQQLIIMLNRRGYSTFVMCRSCGQVITCDHCSMPMVYHVNGVLSCHHCDVQKKVPDICPKCGSTYIKYFGSGTEKLEQELAALVPAARIIRMDRDTTGKKDAHNNILNAFRRHEYDILLGTQMVAKGHDIPNVTAVGIISADSSLNVPDFRAAERCFMLITQTAGRAGRGDFAGKVIVQTYNTEHYAVQTALQQNYEAFYNRELDFRKKLFFPPFCRLVKLIIRHKNESTAKNIGIEIKNKFLISQSATDSQIIGPVPALMSKWRDYYRFCILIKTMNLTSVQEFLTAEKLNQQKDIMIDIDPISIN